MKELLDKNLADLERTYRCDDHVAGPHFLGHSIFQLNYLLVSCHQNVPEIPIFLCPEILSFLVLKIWSSNERWGKQNYALSKGQAVDPRLSNFSSYKL